MVSSKIDFNKNGLSTTEAKIRLKKYGENIVVKKKKTGPVLIFLSKFKNPLIILLITISIVSFSLGQKASAVIVMMMVFLSAILDFLNSYKSQQAVEKLVSRVSIKVTAIRDGVKKEIDFKDVVPGDLIFLSAGNIIPADCQVVESDDFFVNQSSLTGESIPVEKAPSENVNSENASMEDINIIFMGTSVVSGFATAKVLHTGSNTEFGKIAKDLDRAKLKTDFEVSITKFSIFIMKVVFYMVSFVFIVYLVKNAAHLNKGIILEAFTFALAVTIGVTPDMLPAIITICLSKGSQLMAKKEVIVKHLASIENFGSMDILCTDKTGTLTQDHITLVKCINYNGQDCRKVLEFGYLSSFFHTGIQNPLDNAIKDFKEFDLGGYEKIDEIPYDFTRKRSSMVVKKDGKRFLITKGAPEEIVKICKFQEVEGKIGDYEKAESLIIKKFTDLSLDGFRVLGLCYKEMPDDGTLTYERGTEAEMIFAGFLAFLDPPKESVIETIKELNELGIQVKILTGDNDLLAQKICRDIGLVITGVINGKEISNMNEIVFMEKVLEANIFARVTPDQKEKIILALKKAGKTVGFLGDGINDAPALRAADVGISVNNAVDIAKDTADIILMQKSLESLKDGVVEGRKTFHNTLKYVLMGLSSNFGNMFSMMGAATFLPFLPMLPSQILLNNFIYDASQFSLPSDSVDEDDLQKPAHWDLKFIRNYMIVFGLMSSIFDFLTFFLLYYVYHLTEHQFQTGWFIESIATQVFVIYIIRTKKVPFLKSRPSKALFITTFLAVVVAWSIQFTVLGKWMQFDRLPIMIMAIIFSYVLVYLVLVEIAKRFFYRHYNKKNSIDLIKAPTV
jgi:Mg2+-importing ATPase